MSAERGRPGVGITAATDRLISTTPDNNSTAALGIIRISEKAEAFIEQLSADLQTGVVELWQLPRSLTSFYWFAWFSGNGVATSPEIDRLNHELDRLYVAAFNPPLPEPSNYLTYAQLEQLRADIYGGIK